MSIEELFGEPELENIKTDNMHEEYTLNEEEDIKFKINSVEQEKVIETDCSIYIKRCERELINGNYNLAKDEIEKAIKFSNDKKEKEHCLKEKIKILKGEDYVNFVKQNSDEFIENYGLSFLLRELDIKCSEKEKEDFAGYILMKRIKKLDLNDFYNIEKFIKKDVEKINEYLRLNIQILYTSLESGNDGKVKFEQILKKLKESNNISSSEVEELLIEYIKYNLKNNKEKRELEYLIELYINLNNDQERKIELLEEKLMNNIFYGMKIKNIIIDLKIKYFSSKKLAEYIENNREELLQMYSIDYIVDKVILKCSKKDTENIISDFLEHNIYKIEEFRFKEYIKYISIEKSYSYIEKNLVTLIKQYSSIFLINLIKNMHYGENGNKLIGEILYIDSFELNRRKRTVGCKEIYENIYYIDNKYIYRYLKENISYISKQIIESKEREDVNIDDIVNIDRDKFSKVTNLEVDTFDYVNFGVLIYKLINDLSLDKLMIKELIMKYISENKDNKNIGYYISIYLDFIGYSSLNRKEKNRKLGRIKNEIERKVGYNKNIYKIILKEKNKYASEEEKLFIFKNDIKNIYINFGMHEIINHINENIKITEDIKLIDFVFLKNIDIIKIDDFIKYNMYIENNEILLLYFEKFKKNISLQIENNENIGQCFYKLDNDIIIDKLDLEELVLGYVVYNIEHKGKREVLEYFIKMYIEEILKEKKSVKKLETIEKVLQKYNCSENLRKEIIINEKFEILDNKSLEYYLYENINSIYKLIGMGLLVMKIKCNKQLEYDQKYKIINKFYDDNYKNLSLEEFEVINEFIESREQIIKYYKDNLETLTKSYPYEQIFKDIMSKKNLADDDKIELTELIFKKNVPAKQKIKEGYSEIFSKVVNRYQEEGGFFEEVKENISDGIIKGVDAIKNKSVYDVVNDINPNVINKLSKFIKNRK